MADGFAITAIKSKGHANLFTIVTADFEAVRTPTQIGFVHADFAVMLAAFMVAGMTLKQKAVGLHDPMHALVIGPGTISSPCISA